LRTSDIPKSDVSLAKLDVFAHSVPGAFSFDSTDKALSYNCGTAFLDTIILVFHISKLLGML
jgi:hypothetical protein